MDSTPKSGKQGEKSKSICREKKLFNLITSFTIYFQIETCSK
jgi:hypothetical protein